MWLQSLKILNILFSVLLFECSLTCECKKIYKDTWQFQALLVKNVCDIAKQIIYFFLLIYCHYYKH